MEEEVILNKIIQDAKQEASKIIGEAKERAEKITTENQKKASKEAQDQFEVIKTRIIKDKTSMIEKEELLARNSELIERKRAIEIVKEKVKQKIKDLDEKEYTKIIEKLLNKLPEKENVELILPKNHYEKVKEIAEKSGMKVAKINEDFDLGFIAKCGKIEYNYDFEENMEFMDEEIEKEIDAILFN